MSSKLPEVAGGRLIKGVLIAFAIMVVLALIPIVHFVGIPFGPFIGGYFGITSAGGNPRSRARDALVFGVLLGLLVLLVTVVVAAVLTALFGLNTIMIWVWVGVVVYTFYTSSMGALGAMYSQLRSEG